MTANLGYQTVPEFLPDEKEHRRKLARAVNQTLGGKMNASLNATLNASASSTTLIDARISYFSTIVPMPMTANAAAEIGNGTMYIPQATMQSGQAVIQHASNTQTDRTFRFLIIG